MGRGEAEGALAEARTHACLKCPELPPFPTMSALSLHLTLHRPSGQAAKGDPEGLVEPGELPRTGRHPEPGRPQFSKYFECPECQKPFGDPENMSYHVERHREVMAPIFKDGEIVSVACPKGCPRHFVGESNSEYRAHVPMCNGASPLGPRVGPQVEASVRRRGRARHKRRSFSASAKVPRGKRRRAEGPVAQMTPDKAKGVPDERKRDVALEPCTICGKPCSRGAGKAAHMRSHKKAVATVAAISAPAPENSTASLVGDTLAKLRQKRQALLAAVPGLSELDDAIRALERVASGDPT